MYRNILKINTLFVQKLISASKTMLLLMIIIIIIIPFFFLLHCMKEIRCRFSLFPGGLVIYCTVLGVLHL